MGTRGRKSSTELTTPGAVTLIERPAAPLDLTPEQAEEWQAIVDALPADWFQRENFPLLVQYCRHVVEGRRLAQLIDIVCAPEDMQIGQYLELLKAQRQETAALKTLAASMRLAQQAKYNAQSAGTAGKKRGTVKRPWDGD